MTANRTANRRLLGACLAEGGLVLLAILLAWFFDLPLAELLWPQGRILQSMLLGLLATAPMVLFLLWMLRSPWRPIAGLRRQARRLVARLLRGATAGPILAVAIMAGVGEEALFRGALQPLFTQWATPLLGGGAPWAGLLTAALLFGLAHPISRAYIVVAGIGGLYLGALAMFSGEALSAIVAHALYDVVALAWLGPQPNAFQSSGLSLDDSSDD